MTLPIPAASPDSKSQPKRGIYTLGNDVVFDQLVALLNSIEVHMGPDIPVLICPYDARLDRVREEIKRRPNVCIFEDSEAIARWDDFATRLWKTHPRVRDQWQTEAGFEVYRLGMHRRFLGLSGPFEHYIYFDADILVLDSLEKLFEPLNTYDWVVYDFQHKDLTHVFNVDSPGFGKLFERDRLHNNLFCAGMYASRSGLFSPEQCEQFIEQLAKGEADILYPKAPDQSILNYMVLRSGASVYNLAHQLPSDQVTGCCVTSPHFHSAPVASEEPGSRHPTLYDRHTPLTYLHYIGISSNVFTRLCSGENLDVPYRDLFLHYRYLHEPDHYPSFQGRAKPYNPPPSFRAKLMRKLGLVSA